MKKILGCLYALIIILGITGCREESTIVDAIAIATDETGTFLINAKQEKLYIKYDDIISEFSDIIIVRHQNQYGYINNEGKTLLKPTYQMAYPFSENKAVVVINNQYHIIDVSGTILYTLENGTTSNSYFSEGMLVVEQNGKFGYLNDKFELVIECTFDSAAPFFEGQAAVGKLLLGEMRYSYIDKKGEYKLTGTTLQTFKYYSASYFNNGFAKVSLDGVHYVFVNANHQVILDTIRYERFEIRTGQTYYINEKIDYAQDSIYVLPDGTKYMVVAYNTSTGRDYYFYNTSSQLICNYYNPMHRLGLIENNYLPINLNNGSYGLFYFTTNPLYTPGSKFESEKFPYYFKSIKINSKNVYTNTPMGIDNFRNGFGAIYTFSNKYGLIDIAGNVILEPKYTQIKY